MDGPLGLPAAHRRHQRGQGGPGAAYPPYNPPAVSERHRIGTERGANGALLTPAATIGKINPGKKTNLADRNTLYLNCNGILFKGGRRPHRGILAMGYHRDHEVAEALLEMLSNPPQALRHGGEITMQTIRSAVADPLTGDGPGTGRIGTILDQAGCWRHPRTRRTTGAALCSEETIAGLNRIVDRHIEARRAAGELRRPQSFSIQWDAGLLANIPPPEDSE